MSSDYLRDARVEIERSVAGLDTLTIGRNVPARWSIAEILEHLTLAFNTNAAWLEKALASGHVKARRPKLHEILIRTLVIDLGYFPRARAPEMTRPTRSIPPERSVEAILEALATVEDTLARVSDRFGDSVRVANHPYFAGLTVPQWCKFHWRHTCHHMKQVRARRMQ